MPLKTVAVIAGLVRRCAVVALACAPVYAGPASGQSIAPRKDTGKCVGIISAIGDTVAVAKTGFTVFNNENFKVPIDAWRIDDLVFSKISSVLGRRSNLKRISVPQGSFAVLEEGYRPFSDPAEEARAILAKVITAPRCDRYIVVMKIRMALKTGQRVDGLGLSFQGNQYYASAAFSLNVYDGQNFALLEKHQALTGEKNFLGRRLVPGREVDKTWWPTANGTLGPAARDGFRSFVLESLEATVPELSNS
ncbi:hypothetical protein [Bosea sp. (in: a-proteobacteria)]|uniref:hypothetical protein n=1 Tax=Bosea sp. (in: a-proteobacteria) TaxID=1871050 RepID=UPI00262CC337|nr:hypothetical protein [Bosea sp. (in: a-proteobacteria)]MCO5093124.1 hypothetical protein [Bosea sp. (in: a-proteobacteria)]